MWKIAAVLVAVSFALGADKDTAGDPWDKVKKLKTGSDLRIYKTGTTEPVKAKSVDVTERKLLVIIRNAETAISKAEGDSASMTIGRSTTRDGWQTVYQRPAAK